MSFPRPEFAFIVLELKLALPVIRTCLHYEMEKQKLCFDCIFQRNELSTLGLDTFSLIVLARNLIEVNDEKCFPVLSILEYIFWRYVGLLYKFGMCHTYDSFPCGFFVIY